MGRATIHRASTLALVVAVCLAEVTVLGVVRGPDDVTASVQGNCPGAVTLQWDGAEADRWMGLMFARTTGRFTIPQIWCAGTEMGLGTTGLRLVALMPSGSEGSGERPGRVNAFACGGYLQLIVNDGFPCSTSNVVQIPQ